MSPFEFNFVYFRCNKQKFVLVSFGWFGDVSEALDLQSPKPFFILVATKCDLKSERAVSTEEIQELAKSYTGVYVETSAKSGEGFENLQSEIEQHAAREETPQKTGLKAWLKGLFS